MLKEGSKAPAFKVEGIDEKGNEFNLASKDLANTEFIIYFYPRDNTPGCTTEACDFTDNLNRLKSSGHRVFGVSPDSIASHKKFREKQNLKIALLSDPDKKIAEKYGAFGEKVMYGKKTKGIIRSTFIVGTDGKVKKLWTKVKAKGHVQAVLDAIKEL
ncbi:MAG: thioredoxin-dependent thiol peroxidase [Deltaproteobacteria bacterium]|nr:thioredoxin-dependent thiol peroxidase [Deltaproteobacteria bacterium]